MSEIMLIGIHGLQNKPPANYLEQCWASAIDESLRRNCNIAHHPSFTLAYWADLCHKTPIPVAEFDEPYIKADGDGPFERCQIGILDKTRAVAEKWNGELIDKGKQLFGLSQDTVDALLGANFDDLRVYYDNTEKRQQIRARLAELLEEYKPKRLMLIAHSMGSIVAYDVLRSYENSGLFQVEHLITVGSPLGLPLVAYKIQEEFGSKQTPQNVQRWTNFADPWDKVALDCNLADEYETNSHGVQVSDALIHNLYVNPQGKANHHNICGYLRTPEVCECVRKFLMSGT
ncbi:MAG: alpha/beta hydrolase [Caldilineaceae bacterium]